jgi:serine/threonine protein phosphatase PrpC
LAAVVHCTNPACGEPVRPEDTFCEACGQPAPLRLAELGGWASSWEPDRDTDRSEAAFADLAAVSDRGLRRTRNEDAIGVARLEGPPSCRIIVVCDGVSTSAEPAAAAQAAADAALAYLVAAARDRHPNAEGAMREAVLSAQGAVCGVTYSGSSREEPPATTLVAALLRDRAATIGWVGDSRAYFVSASSAWQISRDDTWLAEQVELGLLDEETALADPRAHALTKWLGGDQDGQLKASVSTFAIPASGCLLLCSDGLWNYAPSAERMRELVLQFPEDATAIDLARGLTEFARTSGGADNITVAVAFV